MALKRRRDLGGEQLALIKPDSPWRPPPDLPDLRRAGTLVLDTEGKDEGISTGRGSGWPYGAGWLSGVAAAWREGGQVRSLYAPVRHPEGDCLDRDQVIAWLRDHLASPELTVVMHHSSHDLGWLQADWGLRPPNRLADTEAESSVVDENRYSYKLDDLCRWRGVPGKDKSLLLDAAAAYGHHGPEAAAAAIGLLPARYVGPYAEQDAASTLLLHESLQADIDAQGLRAAVGLEHDLIPLVLEMRRRGIRVDVDYALLKKAELLAKRDAKFEELRLLIGERAGMDEIGSNRWLVRVFEAHAPEIRIPRTAPTTSFPDGQPSFTAGATGWMRNHPHPLVRVIVEADRLNNCATKFMQGFIVDYAHRGRVHASINQYRGDEGGARTSRFSYSNPGLQQAPAREEEMAEAFRGAFLPEDGELWGAHDISQQEYRLIVHYASLLRLARADEAVRMYREDPGTDFHGLVVEWTALDRKQAKNANFAKAYRAGVGRFADMIGQSEAEAATIYRRYDKELPFVSALMEECEHLARRRGYLKLLDGARAHFDLWEPAGSRGASGAPREVAERRWPGQRLVRAGTYKAGNRLIQGSAARMTKLIMRACWREGLVPLIQMHDELGFSHGSEAHARRVGELMRETVRLEVPVMADAEFGPSWGLAGLPWDEARRLSEKVLQNQALTG